MRRCPGTILNVISKVASRRCRVAAIPEQSQKLDAHPMIELEGYHEEYILPDAKSVIANIDKHCWVHCSVSRVTGLLYRIGFSCKKLAAGMRAFFPKEKEIFAGIEGIADRTLSYSSGLKPGKLNRKQYKSMENLWRPPKRIRFLCEDSESLIIK